MKNEFDSDVSNEERALLDMPLLYKIIVYPPLVENTASYVILVGPCRGNSKKMVFRDASGYRYIRFKDEVVLI